MHFERPPPTPPDEDFNTSQDYLISWDRAGTPFTRCEFCFVVCFPDRNERFRFENWSSAVIRRFFFRVTMIDMFNTRRCDIKLL